MLISDEKRFLFVHVPKTGGSSISSVLARYALPRPSRWYSLFRPFGFPRDYRRFRFLTHAPLVSAERIMPAEAFRSYFKFGFVRNPWDRLVSEYNAVRENPRNPRSRRLARLDGFCGYLRHEAPRVVRGQIELLGDATGEIGVDFVGRFENLEEDFRRVCERLGVTANLGRVNVHPHAAYRTFYDDETRELVRELYARDVETFGYEF